MKKSFKFTIISIVALLIILLVIPQVFESKIRKEAPGLLTLNGFKILHEGEFDMLQQEIEYIVERNNERDTVAVKFTDGALTIHQVVVEPVQLVEALASLLEKESAFEKANKVLGEKATFKWGGYSVEDWTADFQTRLSKINIANKKKELADLEARLSKHISQEKRDEMDLADIAKKLS